MPASCVAPLTSAVLIQPFSVLAIVVVYKILPTETPTLISLEETVRRASAATLRTRIIVADNTPGGQEPGLLPAGVEYRAYPHNPGLVEPYNDAIATARSEGYEWLLTLDQDTCLPADFLEGMIRSAVVYADNRSVAAVVPWISDKGRVISPFRFVGGFLPKVLTPPVRGLVPRSSSALNSASLLRVTSLAAVGGYDPYFPLHNSDTRIYQKLDQGGFRMALADDMMVPHELSILRREERITPERYRKMLADERVFWDRCMGPAGRAERLVRLMGRLVKGLLQKEAAVFQRVTLEEMLYRLFHSRRRRMLSQDS
jgi:GT2 family glycosyltransferase